MIALGNLLVALAGLIHFIIQFYLLVLIGSVIISWVSADPRNPIVQFIYGATEPLLRRVRSKIPPLGMLDLSPLIVMALLYFVDAFLAGSLRAYRYQMLGEAMRLDVPPAALY